MSSPSDQLTSILSSLDASTVKKRRLAWEHLELLCKRIRSDDAFATCGISQKTWGNLLGQVLPEKMTSMIEKQKTRKNPDVTEYANLFLRIVEHLVPEVPGDATESPEWLLFSANLVLLYPKALLVLFQHIQEMLTDSDFTLIHLGAAYCAIFRRCVAVHQYAAQIQEAQFKKLFSMFLSLVLREGDTALTSTVRSGCAACLHALLRSYSWDIPRKLSKSIMQHFHTTFTSLTESSSSNISLILPLLQAFNTFLERRLLHLMGTYRSVFHDILPFLCGIWSSASNNIQFRAELCKLFQISLRAKFHRHEIPMDAEELIKILNEIRRGLNNFPFVTNFTEYENLLREDSHVNSHHKIYFNLAAEVFYYVWQHENNNTIQNRSDPSHQPQKRQKLMSISERITEGLNNSRHVENWIYMLEHLCLLHGADFRIDSSNVDALFGGVLDSDRSSAIAKDIALRIFTNVVHYMTVETRLQLWTYCVRLITTETQALVDSAFVLLARIVEYSTEEERSDWDLTPVLRSEYFSANSSASTSTGSVLFLLSIFSNSKIVSETPGIDESSVERYTEWLVSSFKSTVPLSLMLTECAASLLLCMHSTHFSVSVDSLLAHDPTRRNKRWHIEIFDTLSLVYNPLHTLEQKKQQESISLTMGYSQRQGTQPPTQPSVNDSLFNDSLNDSLSVSVILTSNAHPTGSSTTPAATNSSDTPTFKLASANSLVSSFDLITFPLLAADVEQQFTHKRRTPTKSVELSTLQNSQYCVNMAQFASHLLSFEKNLQLPPSLLASMHSLFSRALQYIALLLSDFKTLDNAVSILRVTLPLITYLNQKHQDTVHMRPSHEAQISHLMAKASTLVGVIVTRMSRKTQSSNDSFLLMDTDDIPESLDRREGISMLNFLFEYLALLGAVVVAPNEVFSSLTELTSKQLFQSNFIFKLRVADTLICMRNHAAALKLFTSRMKIANIPEAQNVFMRALLRFLSTCDDTKLTTEYKAIGDVIRLFVDLWSKDTLPERLRLTLCKLLIATFKHENLLSDLFSKFFDFVHDPDYVVRLEALSFIAQLVATYEDPVMVFKDIVSEIQSDGVGGDMNDLTPRAYLIALTYFACEPVLEKSAVMHIVQARMQPQGNVPPDFYDYISHFIAQKMKYAHAFEVYSAHIEDIVYSALTEENSPIEINNLPVRLFGPYDDFRPFFSKHAHRIIPLVMCLNKQDVLERIANSMHTPVMALLKEHFASVYAYCFMASSSIAGSFALLNQYVQGDKISKLARASMTEIVSSMLHFMRTGEALPFFSHDAAQSAIHSFVQQMKFNSLSDFISQHPVELFIITVHLLTDLQSSTRDTEVRHIADQMSLILGNIDTQHMNDPFVLRTVLHSVAQLASKEGGLLRACELLQKVTHTMATPLNDHSRDVLTSQLNVILGEASKNIGFIARPYAIVEVFVDTLERFQSELFDSFGLTIPQHDEFARLRQTYERYFSAESQIKRIQRVVDNDDISAIPHLAQQLIQPTSEATRALMEPQHNELLSRFVKQLTHVVKGHYDAITKKSASDILGSLGVAVYSQTRSDAIPEAYNEFEFVSAPYSFEDWDKDKVREFYHVKLLELLSKYLIDSDVVVVKTAAQTIRRLLTTDEGKRALAQLDTTSRLYIDPFQSKPAARIVDQESQSQRIPTLQECFSGLKDHRKWVRNVSYALIKHNHIPGDAFLNMCDCITRLKGRFAELVWILGMYNITVFQSTDTTFLIIIEDLIKTNIIVNPKAPTKSIRLVLFSLSLLFKQKHFDYARMPKVPVTNRPDYILNIPSIDLAKAAYRAGAEFSSLQYIELSMERKGELIKLSHQDVIFEADQKPEESLLLDIYTKIDEPDGIYGITDVYAPKSHILRAEHEENWAEALSSYDSLLQNNTPDYSTFSEARQHSGLLQSVQNLGYEHVASSYSMFLLQNQSNKVDKRLKEHIFEGAWRQEQWQNEKINSELNVQGFHHAIFKSLQCIHHQQFSNVPSYLSIAQQEVQSQFSSNFFPTLVQYQMIVDIQQVASYLRADQTAPSTLDLISKLSDTTVLKNHAFSSFEPLLALRYTLLNLIKKPELTVQLACNTVAFARREGNISYAKNLIHRIHLNHTKHGVVPYWLYEESKVLWKQGEKQRAVNMMRFFVRMAEAEYNNDPSVATKMGLALKSLGKWLGSTGSDSSDSVRVFMKKAIELCNDKSSAYYAFAKFEDSLFKACERRLKSEETEIQKRLRVENQQRIQDYSAYVRQNPKNGDMRRALHNLEKIVQQEKQRMEDLEQRTKEYLQNALNNYGLAAKNGDAHSLETVFRFVSLWLKFPEDQDLNSAFWNLGRTVPAYKFVPLVYQIASRLASSNNVKFNAVVQHILVLIISHSPQHSLFQVFALKNGGLKSEADYFVPDTKRISAASSVISHLAKNNLREVVDEMSRLISAYVELAYHPISDKEKKAKNIPLKKSLQLRSVGSLPHVHVPTKELPIDPQGRYEDIMTSIVSFDNTYSLAGGVNLPKIIKCIGSDQKSYRQLVKGNDDLRQDAVMQQVFELVNNLLQAHHETRRRKLRIRTYKVIPLSPRSGILGWVENTIPLATYLVGGDADMALNCAHVRYRPTDELWSSCRAVIHNASKSRSFQEKLQAYQKVCRNFKPVFHHFFTERFPDAHDWYLKRLAYIRSVAANSIVGYILGLGDRHIFNILLDVASAEVVHIDLGIAFDQGQLLPVPEVVPFRLTRDIEDGFGISGVEGVFRRCCVSTMTILRQNIDLLYTIVEVLLHDPLYSWTIDPIKSINVQRNRGEQRISRTVEQNATTTSGEEVKNRDAGRVLIRFMEKLQGYENNELLGVEGHVNKLINQARSEENLSQLFSGWSAFV